MSVTDRAFIKAYAWDRPEPALRGPYLEYPPAAASEKATSADAAARPAQQASARTTRIIDDTAHNATVRPAHNTKLPNSLHVARQPVTQFVPPPHISLSAEQERTHSERKPLSVRSKLTEGATIDSAADSDTVTEHGEVARFEPAMGVPYFLWPEVCERFQQDAALDAAPLCAALSARQNLATREAGHVVAVTSLARGEGRTTASLCAARALAANGMRTIVVEGDFVRPSLTEQLQIVTTTGWEDALTGRLLLAEAAIYSEEDDLAVLPLGETVRDPHAMASALHASISLAVLSQHYDVVLVDVGPLVDEPSTAVTLLRRARFTGALLVQDLRRATMAHGNTARQKLAEFALPLLGVIENFHAHAGREGATPAAGGAAA